MVNWAEIMAERSGGWFGMPAFLTGLPRSRTYWFARYFDDLSGVTGAHELSNGCKTKAEFHAAHEGQVVNCDSGLFITDWQARWPASRTVIIHRDLSAVLQSLSRLMDVSAEIESLLAFQREVLSSVKGLHVRFEDINERIEDIHRHLVDVEFDRGYADKMCETNLQLSSIEGDIDSYLLWAA